MSVANSRFAKSSALTLLSAQILAAPVSGIVGFDFLAIPAGYKGLILDMLLRSSSGATGVARATLNGDGGPNYDFERIIADGAVAPASLTVAGQSTFDCGSINGTPAPAGAFSLIRVEFRSVDGAFGHPNWLARTQAEHGGANARSLEIHAGQWRTLAAINAIHVGGSFGVGANFLAGCSARLYGLLG